MNRWKDWFEQGKREKKQAEEAIDATDYIIRFCERHIFEKK